MIKVINSIEVECSKDDLYNACANVENWPNIFPSVLTVHCTSINQDELIMAMTVHNRLGINTIESKRRYDRNAGIINFELRKLPVGIESMHGVWIVASSKHCATLKIIHNYEPENENVGIATDIADNIHRNTEDVLRKLKDWLELRRFQKSNFGKSQSQATI